MRKSPEYKAPKSIVPKLAPYLMLAGSAIMQPGCKPDKEPCPEYIEKHCREVAKRLNMTIDPAKCEIEWGNRYSTGTPPVVCGFENDGNKEPGYVGSYQECTDNIAKKECTEEGRICIEFPDLKDPTGEKSTICMKKDWPPKTEKVEENTIPEGEINQNDGGENIKELEPESMPEKVYVAPTAPVCDDGINQKSQNEAFGPTDVQIYVSSADLDFLSCTQKISETDCNNQGSLKGSEVKNASRITVEPVTQEVCNEIPQDKKINFFMLVKKGAGSAFSLLIRKTLGTNLNFASFKFRRGIYKKSSNKTEIINSVDPSSFVDDSSIKMVEFPNNTFTDFTLLRAEDIPCNPIQTDAEGCTLEFSFKLEKK